MQLVDDVAHVARSEELPLLDVDDAAGLCRRVDEIGLAAQERGDLQHVDDLRRRRDLRLLMDVGHDGHIELFLDRLQHFESLLESRAAEAVERRAVRLVKRRLEDVGDAEPRCDFFDRAPDQKAALHFLKDARPRHEHERASPADREISDLHLVHHHSTAFLLGSHG